MTIDALELLRAEAARTSITAVARRLGLSRPAISGVLSGAYGASSAHILARVMEVLGRHDCPATGGTISPKECREIAARPMPTSSRAAMKRWETCLSCPKNGGGP